MEKKNKELQEKIYKVEDKKDILVNKNEYANKEINELKKQIWKKRKARDKSEKANRKIDKWKRKINRRKKRKWKNK